MRRFATVLLVLFALEGCSKPAPPIGRWAGRYDAGGVLIDARVEIGSNGEVRVSAPDLVNVTADTDDDRAALHQRLAAELADDWDAVEPRPMDYDGHVFRKPGGVAPQLIWDKDSGRMTMVVYIGNRPGMNITLAPVADFDKDPWAG